MAEDDTPITPATVYNTPKGGAYGGPITPPPGLDPNVKALLMNARWTTTFNGSIPATALKYSFPTAESDYTVVAGYPDEDIAGFIEATPFQAEAARVGFRLVQSYTELKLTESPSGLASDVTFRVAGLPDNGTSHAWFPPNEGSYNSSDSRAAGDIFLAANGKPTSMACFGSDAFNTIIHEMGHALGLKHGHDATFNGALADNVNDNEFSVMTYASCLGANSSQVTEAINGSSPQSFMMYDIAALQVLYGANYDKEHTTAIYRWDSSGQQYINGSAAPNTGVSATHKIFTTVWTAGATATYDFSNFNEDASYDLRPGAWSTFSRSQLADLNGAAPADTPQYQAQGNVYNALLHDGDLRSAVSNVIGGGGNDNIMGNQVDNAITGGPGNDRIDGLEGLNTAIYTTAARNYAVTLYAGNTAFEVQDKFGSDGTDSLTRIQHLEFTDHTFDTASLSKVAFSNSDSFIPLDALYASYLQRAPDMPGLHYWTAQLWDGMSILQISESFYVQPETQRLFPTDGTPTQVVTAAYAGALGRAPDAGGLAYWVGELEDGNFSNGSLLIALINGALQGQDGSDRSYVINRAYVGGTFALTQGLSNLDWAETAMTGVDDSQASVDAAIATIDGYAATAAAQATSEFVVKLVGVNVG